MGQDQGQFGDGANSAGRAVAVSAGSFDGYDFSDVPLGDLMRGERATLGKSLLDVERELKIRAAYIAAIENGDVGAFSSPGFIAGYVRSYARYLGIDPEWSYRRFCAETGFYGVHDASQQNKTTKRATTETPRLVDPNEVIAGGRISFAPSKPGLFSTIEPGALGSAAVLVALVLGIGYGAWAVLHDIQRLQIAPIEDAPMPLAELDPLAGARIGNVEVAQEFGAILPGQEDAPRLFRPLALDAPVLTPRDGALATLDPDAVGAIGPDGDAARSSPLRPAFSETAAQEQTEAATFVQVTEARDDELVIFAVRPSWIRVSAATGATLFEGTLNRGDSYTVALAGDAAPVLRSGNAGSVYFMVNGVTLGPAGPGATVVRDIELSADAVTASYNMADAQIDPDLPAVAALVIGSADGN
ncbi:helix-turn-helix domain-containing protein [Roseicyclus sp.]|uniref:helix-turn-helix domain-containing protein n=1 Tax=Roseicyclus sp. TaxID=1914329 RepID=UPI003F6D77F1